MADVSCITTPSGNALDVRDKKALRAAAAAPEFSSTKTYYAGFICSYDGKVYSANQYHKGAWNSGHFTERDPLQAQIDAIKVGYSLVYMGAANDGPLTDRAVNSVEVTQQEALFTLPAASGSIARDFYVRMNVVSPGCRVQFSSAVWDCSGIDPDAYYGQCTYLLHFLEVDYNTFHVLDVSAVSRIEKALKSGPHVQNPSTGLWHRLIAQTDSQGRISIGVDQTGVASWPRCQCDDGYDSGSDSGSDSGADPSGPTCTYVVVRAYNSSSDRYGMTTVTSNPGHDDIEAYVAGCYVNLRRSMNGAWSVVSYDTYLTNVSIECDTGAGVYCYGVVVHGFMGGTEYHAYAYASPGDNVEVNVGGTSVKLRRLMSGRWEIAEWSYMLDNVYLTCVDDGSSSDSSS